MIIMRRISRNNVRFIHIYTHQQYMNPVFLGFFVYKTDRYLMSLVFLSSSQQTFFFITRKIYSTKKRRENRIKYDQFNQSLFLLYRHRKRLLFLLFFFTNDKHRLINNDRWFYTSSFLRKIISFNINNLQLQLTSFFFSLNNIYSTPESSFQASPSLNSIAI